MWTFILCKSDGTELGEIRPAGERNVTLSINRPSTASFTIYQSNELLFNLFNEDTLLRVYQDGTPRFYGYVLTPEFSFEGPDNMATVKVNAANPAWRLARRILGQSKGGTNYTGDKAASTKTMIDELNAIAETGIKTQVVSSGSSGTYVGGPYKAALGCINDLAHGLDGFDWYISPLVDEEPKLGLYEADATFGEAKSAVFEYGWGQKNVRQFKFVRDISNLTNKAIHLPDNGLEEGTVLTKSDATSQTEHGLYEEIADAFGLEDTTLRNKWLEEVIRVKKNPRFVTSMTLDIDDGTGRVPVLGEDFWLGDFVGARAVVEDSVTLFNGSVRVYQVNVSIDQNGNETVTPTLIEEGE